MPNAKFYWKHRERLLAQEANRYKDNRDRILNRNKAWNAAHPESMKAADKRWVKRNPNGLLEKTKKYSNSHREECRARCRDYQKKNPEIFLAKNQKRRTSKTKAGGSFTADEWKELCKKYNNICLCCGKHKKLTADHVIPVSKGGTSNIDNIQPLCGPCNSKKKDKIIDFRREQCTGKMQSLRVGKS